MEIQKYTQNEYIEKNKERFLEELFSILKIPSISTDSRYKKDVVKCASELANLLEKSGIEKVTIHTTKGNPIITGEKIMGTNCPTVLVYGHYDVQPPDPLDLWNNPPFEPTITDEKIYCRGACDDKGQMYMHIKAVETLVNTNICKCNVKFLLEGEEEIGSKSLEDFLETYKKYLQADAIIISDTALINKETPSITVGLRGLCYMEIEVTGPNKDLHSGVYGGAVENPINVLCSLMHKIKNEKGEITVPHFYDTVDSLSSEERKKLNEQPFDLDTYKRSLSLEEVFGEEGFNTIERTSIRPTFDINGIFGGYTGEGAKTVLPSKATAKISMRLVPHQNPEEIEKLVKNYIEKICPKTVKLKFTTHHGGNPVVTSTNSDAYHAASKAFLEAWGKEPIPAREGGSIPIVSLFQKKLQTEPLLMGFGLNEDAIHSPNESYGLFNYFKGIETIILFYKYYSTIKRVHKL